MWRLRLSVVGVLILLIMMTAAGSRTTERIAKRQQALNSAYKLHILSTDLDSAVRDVKTAASGYIHDRTSAQRISLQQSLAETRKRISNIQTFCSASPFTPECYTDLLPRSRLYLDTLEGAMKLRDAARQQEARKVLVHSNFDYERLTRLSMRLRSEEEIQLAHLTRGLEQETEQERHKMWFSTSLLVVLLGIVGLVFSRDLGARTRKEQALRSANRKLTRLAEQDGLTRLKNRRALEEELHAEWARARRSHSPLSLLFVDVDKFKDYNDTFGHQAGDQALKQVADLLRQEERLSGCCVARYGGEEFAVVLPKADTEQARRVGERVRASFEAAFWSGRPVTASVGAATISQGVRSEFSDVETLLYEADSALYHAKREGRNRVAHAADLPSLPSLVTLTAKRV